MLENLSVCDFTPKDELETRIGRFREALGRRGIDYAVILQNVDLFYFTGSVQNAVFVLPVDGEPLFLVQKNVERARIESPLEMTPIKRDKDVRDILANRKILSGRAGMELDVIPVAVYERWKSILGIDGAADLSEPIRELKIIKSPYELKQFRKSGEICAHIFEKGKEVIREGMREVDIDAILGAEGRRFGHQGFLRMRGLNQEMMTIYITHGRSSTIHSAGDVPISGVGITHAIGQGASLNVVQRDVPLLIDYGGGYNGYITDETRVYVVGRLPEKFLGAYEAAREIIEDATAFGKEGVNGIEVFERSAAIAGKAGLKDHFMGHGKGKVGFIGHGLGLEINELPVITPRHDIVLKEGMVFAFEPKFIFPGEGAVGIEVDFIVRKDRFERVSDYPIDVIYV
jgi:Xaa-Pro aminopeptidase